VKAGKQTTDSLAHTVKIVEDALGERVSWNELLQLVVLVARQRFRDPLELCLSFGDVAVAEGGVLAQGGEAILIEKLEHNDTSTAPGKMGLNRK